MASDLWFVAFSFIKLIQQEIHLWIAPLHIFIQWESLIFIPHWLPQNYRKLPKVKAIQLPGSVKGNDHNAIMEWEKKLKQTASAIIIWVNEKKKYSKTSKESKRLNNFCKLCKTKEYFINKILNVITFVLLPFTHHKYSSIVNAYKYLDCWCNCWLLLLLLKNRL